MVEWIRGLVVLSLLTSASSLANFELAKNNQFVGCSGANNLIVEIQGDRSRLSVIVEGQGLGFLEVKEKKTDGLSFVAYVTPVGTLYLDDQGDAFAWAESGEKWNLTCSSQL